MNTPRLPKPSLNGHHDPAELERKRHLRQLKEKAHKSLYLWFGCLLGFGVVVALLALILSLIAVSK
jgi:hypothetical protein